MSDIHNRKHKKRSAPAVTSLDEDEQNSSATSSDSQLIHHRFSLGGLTADMTVVMDSFPQHRFCVHKQVMALNSTYFSTLIPHLDASNITHIPAGSPRASVGAMLLILNMIYNPKEYIELQSGNTYIKSGDIVSQIDDDNPEEHVHPVHVEHVYGLKGSDVRISSLSLVNGRDYEFTYDGSKYDMCLHLPVTDMKPRSPLPRLHQMTTTEHLLPLLAYFDGHTLLWPIEEHLIATAYLSDPVERVRLLQTAAQYKLARAFNQIVAFCNVWEIRRVVEEQHMFDGLNNATLKVMVKRLAEAASVG